MLPVRTFLRNFAGIRNSEKMIYKIRIILDAQEDIFRDIEIEESNTLDSVLVNIAEGMEKQTVRRLDLMVKLIEPLMLVLLAGIILLVVIALLLPVMKLGAAVQ